MKKGLLIVFSGVSGVGKGTILSKLMPMKELNLVYSVSMTTRKPREGEIEGVNYFFVSKKRFVQAIKNDELLEHARFVGNDYGTPKEYVEKMMAEGKNVVLEIEINGAKQIIDIKVAIPVVLRYKGFERLYKYEINCSINKPLNGIFVHKASNVRKMFLQLSIYVL